MEIKANVSVKKNVTAQGKAVTPITKTYTGIENDTTETVVDNKKNTIEVNLKPHNFATRFDFPNQGNEAVIYIDENENKAYRWSNTELKYNCVGSDYTDIKIIYGGDSKNG